MMVHFSPELPSVRRLLEQVPEELSSAVSRRERRPGVKLQIGRCFSKKQSMTKRRMHD
jgi:hypothetical protein